MSTDVIKKLLEETEATGKKMDSKNDSFSEAIEQMEKKLKVVQEMQSDVQKFTNGNVKKVQNIQTEWSNAMKTAGTKTPNKKNVVQSPSAKSGKTESLISIGSKGKTRAKVTSTPLKFKANKVSTPGVKGGQNKVDVPNQGDFGKR